MTRVIKVITVIGLTVGLWGSPAHATTPNEAGVFAMFTVDHGCVRSDVQVQAGTATSPPSQGISFWIEKVDLCHNCGYYREPCSLGQWFGTLSSGFRVRIDSQQLRTADLRATIPLQEPPYGTATVEVTWQGHGPLHVSSDTRERYAVATGVISQNGVRLVDGPNGYCEIPPPVGPFDICAGVYTR